ncbi:MAG: hypothetical protein RSD57_04055 [Comamonas sp.]
MTANTASPWVLDAQWPVFAGHFPAHPVLPGALLLDWVIDSIQQQSGRNVVGVAQTKFSRAAEPGDVLTLALRPDGTRVRFEVRATRATNEHTVASGIANLAVATTSTVP